MQRSGLANLVLRVLLLVSACAVLGLAVWLNNEFDYILNVCSAISGDADQCDGGRWPSAARYAIFTGIFGLITALIGIVPTFVARFVWFPALIFDVLAAVFYFAGGVNLAVVYHDTAPCSDSDEQLVEVCDAVMSRTRADIAFLFVGFVLTIVAIPLLFTIRRNNKNQKAAQMEMKA